MAKNDNAYGERQLAKVSKGESGTTFGSGMNADGALTDDPTAQRQRRDEQVERKASSAFRAAKDEKLKERDKRPLGGRESTTDSPQIQTVEAKDAGGQSPPETSTP